MVEAVSLMMLIVFAFLIGIFAALSGVGGGLIIVPILVSLYGFPSHQAVGTSSAMIVFTAISSTWAYWKQHRIDIRLGLVTAVLTVPSAFAGAFLTTWVTPTQLVLIFGVAIIIISLRFLTRERLILRRSKVGVETNGWHRRIRDAQGNVSEYYVNLPLGVGFMILGGVAAGFLGIGGGLIIVPVYAMLLSMPIHLAVATSLFSMIFSSISAASGHFLLGNVRLESAVILGIGIVVGTQVGAHFAARTKRATMERIYSIVILTIGVWLIYTHLPEFLG
jgi:uncharacterized membrane protein YfcA